VKLWHLLSHTSAELSGANYRYDGNAFGMLTQAIERTTGQPFARELADRIMRPLGLSHTAPNPGDPSGFRSLFASFKVSPEDEAPGRSIFGNSGIEPGPIKASLDARLRPLMGTKHLAIGPGRADASDAAWIHLVSGCRPRSFRSRRREVLKCLGPGPAVKSGYAGTCMDADEGVRRSGAAICTGLVCPKKSRDADCLALRPRPRVIVTDPQDPGATGHVVILANSDGLSRGRRLADKADVSACPAATALSALRGRFSNTLN